MYNDELERKQNENLQKHALMNMSKPERTKTKGIKNDDNQIQERTRNKKQSSTLIHQNDLDACDVPKRQKEIDALNQQPVEMKYFDSKNQNNGNETEVFVEEKRSSGLLTENNTELRGSNKAVAASQTKSRHVKENHILKKEREASIRELSRRSNKKSKHNSRRLTSYEKRSWS